MEFSWQRIHDDPRLPSGNYADNVMNQHAGGWCGACYLVSTAQMIRDRVHIALARRHKKRVPAPRGDFQRLLERFDGWNAQPGWTACRGGYPEFVLDCMRADAACRSFLSLEESSSSSSSLLGHVRFLERLLPPPPPPSVIEYELGDVERVQDSDVRAALRRDGPLLLEISAKTVKSVDDRGIVQDLTMRDVDHVVCCIGWTRLRDGCDAWILRNSWGKKRAPMRLPQCAATGSNDPTECDAQWIPWRGDPQNLGFFYLPCVYTQQSPITHWISASVRLIFK